MKLFCDVFHRWRRFGRKIAAMPRNFATNMAPRRGQGQMRAPATEICPQARASIGGVSLICSDDCAGELRRINAVHSGRP
jgi:hypothetical protein